MASLTRREWIKRSLAASATGAVFTLAPWLVPKASGARKKDTLEEMLKKHIEYAEKHKWDPVYGAPLFVSHFYRGVHDFKAHQKYAVYANGVDYDMKIGTILVSPLDSMQHKTSYHYPSGGNELFLGYSYAFGCSAFMHLEKALLPKTNGKWTEKYSSKFDRGTIVALSGDSGVRTWVGADPHLHFGLWIGTKEEGEYVDPEKYGLERGKPIHWDGKTLYGYHKAGYRRWRLEQTLSKDYFEGQIELWSEDDSASKELKGRVIELYKKIGDVKGAQVLDSIAFQDMRALLIKEVLKEKRIGADGKRIYVPGTVAFHLMSSLTYYSGDQNLVITFPSPSPDLAKLQLQGIELYRQLYKKAS